MFRIDCYFPIIYSNLTIIVKVHFALMYLIKLRNLSIERSIQRHKIQHLLPQTGIFPSVLTEDHPALA